MATTLRAMVNYFVAWALITAALVFILRDVTKGTLGPWATETRLFLTRQRDYAIDASIRWHIQSLENRVKSAEKTGESAVVAGRARENALRSEIRQLRAKLNQLEDKHTWLRVIGENIDKILAVVFSCLGIYYAREGIRLQQKALDESSRKKNVTAV
ncbi:MAG: hypothetical protein ACK4TP_07065 [Hyphomicrobium sp.]